MNTLILPFSIKFENFSAVKVANKTLTKGWVKKIVKTDRYGSTLVHNLLTTHYSDSRIPFVLKQLLTATYGSNIGEQIFKAIGNPVEHFKSIRKNYINL